MAGLFTIISDPEVRSKDAPANSVGNQSKRLIAKRNSEFARQLQLISMDHNTIHYTR
jgi:hypothetical protein